MGKRGKPPAPTALKLVRGDRRSRVNRNEPIPPPADPAAPSWLTADALVVWKRLAPSLERSGVLTVWDVDVFAGFCTAVALRGEAERHIQEEGAVVEAPVFNKNGDITGHRLQRNQWLLVAKQAFDEVSRSGARFGLTPSDRAQINLGTNTEAEDDLLTG